MEIAKLKLSILIGGPYVLDSLTEVVARLSFSATAPSPKPNPVTDQQ